MSLQILASADADVVAAVRAYDAKPGKYGKALKAEFTAAVRAIAANPRIHSPCEDGIAGHEFREFFIARFQQRVIYLVRGDDVLVVAVVHATQNEGAWHRKVPTDLLSPGTETGT
jgi:plasmid stabilization system protein ParE